MLLTVSAAGFRFEGSGLPVIKVDAEASTGLEGIYVAKGIAGLTVTADGDGEVNWYRFDSSGAAYATPLGNGNTLTIDVADCGYAAECNGRRTYFWLIDYSASPSVISAMTIGEESDCAVTELKIDGTAPRLTAYAINSRPIEVSRELKLSYYTLVEEEGAFRQSEVATTLPYASGTIHADAPLCPTRFTLTGDRFLHQWGEKFSVSTEPATPKAVSAITTVETESRDIPNEQTAPEGETGGSAPLTVTFRATISDAVVFTEWQLASDPEFEHLLMSERSTEFVRTFNDAGSFYVRFNAADATGECTYVSDTYPVSIGESRLRCPNAFSPGASEGVNDIWCVSYRSITEFDCSIFNRWGVRIIRFTDPSQGWDGRYKGKLVDPGVYYYVIKAVGSDGVRYNLSGDINIIGTR